MNILSWNCRGLGQPRTVQELVRLVRASCPKLVFIMETRQHKERVVNLKYRLGYKNCFTVESGNKGGGLVLFWDDSIKLDILSYGLHHIDALIWDENHHAKWRCTCVYGEPRTQDRSHMWELIRRIKPRTAAPWLMIGDFNETMWSFEHFSKRRRPERQMFDFREILSYCDLHDLGFSGIPWTYDNKQEGERNVKVRLDRAVASPQWSDWFPNVRVKHLMSSRSDHCPILLATTPEEEERQKSRILRYEIMWEREESLPDEIKKAWDVGNRILNLGDIARLPCADGVLINLGQ